MMHLTKPNVSFDWSINVSNLISILFGLVCVISAYYSLKADVEAAKLINDNRFALVDKMFAAQNETNLMTNQKIDQVHKDLANQLENSTEDIKGDIRELRQDLPGNITRSARVRPPKIDLNP